MSSADYDGRTALHLACAEGHLSVVRLLLERGVSHKVKDRFVHVEIPEVCVCVCVCVCV